MTATFYEFQKRFPDDAACLEHVMTVRYGGRETHCPSCGAHGRFYRLMREPAYICQHCKYHLFPCVGTPFEKSRTPLHKWFYAMFLFSTSRHGVAAKELQRQLGVTYKCAWRIAHEIRKFMAKGDGEDSLGGIVEVDETYIGGKAKRQGRGYRKNKSVVLGMAARGGDVMVKVVPDVKRRTLEPIIRENVREGSTVHTDELPTHKTLPAA